MEEPKRTRPKLSKEQRRILAEQSTKLALDDNDAKRQERDTKTARLTELRLAFYRKGK